MRRVLLGLLLVTACGDELPAATVSETPRTRPAGLTEEAWGEQLFVTQGCLACHRIDADRLVGPGLAVLTGTRELTSGGTVVVDELYIRRALVEPATDVVRGYTPTMPSYAHLSEADLSALETYLRSIQPPR
ncbi:MAG: cytochrome c [Polyangiales bacterium]